jgi:multisubunit Na+/H+ antiporter MnhC subunit
MAGEYQHSIIIQNYLAQLSNSGVFTNEDLKELKSHIEETTNMLMQQGLSFEEAFEVAKIRMGKKQALVAEYEKVNGINLLNRESVFLFIGIGFTVFITDLILNIRWLISYLAGIKYISIETAAYLTALFFLFISVGIFHIVLKPNFISKTIKSNLIGRSKITAALFAACTGFFFLFDLPGFFGSNFIATGGILEGQIIYFNRLTEFIIKGALPIAITLSIFLSLQTVKSKINGSVLFKSDSLIYLLVLGFGWEALSASSRMIIRNLHLSAFVFGLIFMIGVALVTKYNSNKAILKLAVFSSTTVLFECFGGYFYNDLPQEVARISSPFAWAVFSAIILGYLIGKKGTPTNVD